MLLDRIDIDTHGPLHRVEIGPLTESLNVIVAPEGAGKTAIVRFVRDSLVDREYPTGMMNSSTGRVVWADRYGFVHCRREQDGSAAGRRTIEFESRGEYPIRFDRLEKSWIQGATSTTDASLSLRSMRLPELIVDGVITDTAVTSVARVVHACLSSGLDRPDPLETKRAVDGLDRAPSSSADESPAELRTELAGVEEELARYSQLPDDIEALETRRRVLQGRLRGNPPASAEGRRQVRSWKQDNVPDWTDREAIAAELQRIDEQIGSMARIRSLVSRRDDLQQRLAAGFRSERYQSPLSRLASKWLQRVSGGRLNSVDWNAYQASGSNPGSTGSRAELKSLLEVRIDGRDESGVPAADRALATMAIRLAAGERLARTGQPVPLIFETQRELLRDTYVPQTHPVDENERLANGVRCEQVHPISAALSEYAKQGHQLILLTSSQAMAEELAAYDARVFRLHANGIAHPHRPLWKQQYRAERYVGPHPHTYGRSTAGSHEEQINRDFDVAWREAYGLLDSNSIAPMPTDSKAGSAPAQGPASQIDPRYRDGYFFAERYSTDGPDRQRPMPSPSGRFDPFVGERRPVDVETTMLGCERDRFADAATDGTSRHDSTPFFLSVDSPIDQAPSIDAVVAARLRGLGITHVTHLMQQDANRLADTLGIANVNASAIRRWKDECRLVCRVPQLRGFDARLLVGCGITDPAELASTHPADLLDRVEAFLATERGQRILLSGTSYELSRIASWIASANRNDGRSEGAHLEDRRRRAGRSNQPAFVRDGQELRDRFSAEDVARGSRSRDADTIDRVSLKLRTGRRRTSGGERQRASGYRTAAGASAPAVRKRRFTKRTGPLDKQRDAADRPRLRREGDAQDRQRRFYLQRENEVEAAPSIGPRMAERLAGVGIITVDDLLTADPEKVAEDLDHRRVDGQTVERWQQQSALVCRVPMLRGHDAQLLVAAQITTPEELAECDAESLLAEIEPIVRSTRGKRILRGGDPPDLDEVANWIRFAGHQRPLRAA